MENFKNKTFLDSIICAVRGMVKAFRTEKNFAYYFCIAVFFLLLNLHLGVKSWLYIAYAIPVAGVISAELINTAVEHLCNYVSTEIHPELGIVKDIAAATVLFWGFGYFAVEIMIIMQTVR
ncbi:diacylglycerol kinase (ATP) [Lachnospiraceae bacterium]|nr:diacylglycerol kinase (ATP) [Lachnospiraceae bacterium]